MVKKLFSTTDEQNWGTGNNPSFSIQWTEGIIEESTKRTQEAKNKLEDKNYFKNKKEEYSKDWSNASYENVSDLWISQIGKSIAQTRKDAYEKWKKRDAEFEKKWDKSFWAFLKNSYEGLKDWAMAGISTAWTIVWGTLNMLFWDAIDAIDSAAKEKWNFLTKTAKGIRNIIGEYAGTLFNGGGNIFTGEETGDVKNIINKQAEQENSVKAVANERMEHNFKYFQKENSALQDEANQIYAMQNELQNEQNKLNELNEAKKNGQISRVERDSNYLATKKALMSKKISLDEKVKLFQQKQDEYRQLQKKVEEEEYNLSAYTDEYFTNQSDVDKYNEFRDKVFKNEDGSIFGSGANQKETDVKNVLRSIERQIFMDAEGIKDEQWGVNNSVDLGIVSSDLLKSSDKFLQKMQSTFLDLKSAMLENYDELVDITTNQSGEEVKTLNPKKVDVFLQKHKQGLNEISDTIKLARSWTLYNDLVQGRNYKNEEGFSRAVETIGKEVDALWSMSSSLSKDANLRWQIFSYDKAEDWIWKATGQFGFFDSLTELIAENPWKTAYIAWTSALSVFGKLSWAVKGKSVWNSVRLVKDSKNLISTADAIKDIWYGMAFSKMSGKASKAINMLARKWAGIIDEALVSFPLDIGLMDGTVGEMGMNVLFNTFWGLGKIKSASEFNNFLNQTTKIATKEARKAFFIEKVGIEGLAEIIDFWEKNPEVLKNSISSAYNGFEKMVFWNDKNLSALYMANSINAGIDNITSDHLDWVYSIAKAITENDNIGVSLGKTRAENIRNAIEKGSQGIADTANETEKLAIQNKTVERVKNEFRGLLNNFDIDKLNAAYQRKFVAEKISWAMDNITQVFAKNLWIDETNARLLLMESIVGKTSGIRSQWDVVKDLLKQKLFGGELQSSLWVKGAVRAMNEIEKPINSALDAVNSLVKQADERAGSVARAYNQKEKKFFKELSDMIKESKNKEEIADVAEAIVKPAKKTVKASEDKARSLGERVLHYVEQVGEDERLKAKLDEAQKEYMERMSKDSSYFVYGEEEFDNALPAKERMEVIKDFLKETYNIGDEVLSESYWNLFSRYVFNYTIDPSISKKEIADSIGKITVGGSHTEDVDSFFKNKSSLKEEYDTILENFSKPLDKATEEKITAEQIKQAVTNQWKKTGIDKEIIQGIKDFINEGKTNISAFTKTNIIQWLSYVWDKLEGEVGKRMLIGVVGKLMKSVAANSSKVSEKLRSKLGDELVNILVKQWGGVDTIKDTLRSAMSFDGSMDLWKIKEFVGDANFKKGEKNYKRLIKNKEFDTLLNEVLFDKLRSDISFASTDLKNYIKKLWVDANEMSDEVKAVMREVKPMIEAWGRIMQDIMNYSAIKAGIDAEVLKLSDVVSDTQQWVANISKKVSKSKEIVEETERHEVALQRIKYLTKHEQTLMKFDARSEIIAAAAALEKWEIPVIAPTFLTKDWYGLFVKMMWLEQDWGFLDVKKIAALQEAFLNGKKALKEQGYAMFYGLNNVLYHEWAGLLQTSKDGMKLSDILSAITYRISNDTYGLGKAGGVIFDSRTMLMKYIMESSPEEWSSIIKKFLSKHYFPSTFKRQSIGDIPEQFLANFGITGGDNLADDVAQEFMNIYNRLYLRLKNWGISERVAHDILNPMLYNPMEYVFGAGRMKLNGKQADDIILGSILKRRSGQNYIPKDLMSYADIRANAAVFEAFSPWATIKNKYAIDVGSSFWKFLDTIDTILMKRDAFTEFINKSLGHLLNGGDDIGQGISAIDNVVWVIISNAKNKLWWDRADEVVSVVTDVIFDKNGNLRKTKELNEVLPKIMDVLKKHNIFEWDVKDAYEAIQKSFDEASESRDARVLMDYLFNKSTAETEEYLLKRGQDAKTFSQKSIELSKQAQDIVREKFERNNLKSLWEDIVMMGSGEKTKKVKWGKIVSDFSGEERVKYIREFGLTENQIEDLKNMKWGIDIEAILKLKWDIPQEKTIEYITDLIINEDQSFNYLLENSEKFRDMVQKGFETSFNAKDFENAFEYHTINKDGSFILRHEQAQMNLLQQMSSKLSTVGKVMNEDKETQWILDRIVRNAKSWYVNTKLNFGKLLKTDIVERQGYNVQSYLSMVKKSIEKHSKGVSPTAIDEILKVVFARNGGKVIDLSYLDENGKTLKYILENYRDDIKAFRQKMDLWNAFDFVGRDWLKGNIITKLGNRITGLRTFTSVDDLNRLSWKYDNKVKWWRGVWKEFMQDIMFNSRADGSDNQYLRALEKINFGFQKYVIAKLYNPLHAFKAGQQMLSNYWHAKGIMRTTAVADSKRFNQLYDLIDEKTKHFGFDLFGSEGKYGEKALDNSWIISESEDAIKTKKDSRWVRRKLTDSSVMNVLVWWDKATLPFAVKASMAQALDDVYRHWGDEALEAFETKVKDLYEYMDANKLKESDFFHREKYRSKFNELVAKIPPEETGEFYKRFEKMYDFYHNEYSTFLGKARTQMGTFFVMDNIKELGSIRLIDRNKYMFWLMKWAVGKTGEYLFDIGSAFSKYSKEWRIWMLKAFQEPIFKRMFHEFALAAKASWQVEKMTNHEFTWQDGVLATAVPFAAFASIIGQALYKHIIKEGLWSEDKAIWVLRGLGKVADEVLMKRMFIYGGMIASDLWTPYKTAKEVDGVDNMFEVFAKTLWRKFWSWPILNNTAISSAGYRTDASELIGFGTQLAQMGFNTESTRKEQIMDISNKIYSLWATSYSDNLTNYLPFIRQFTTATADNWVLMQFLKDAAEKTWVLGFLKASTSKTELLRLINNLEKNSAIESDKYKDWVQAHKEYLSPDANIIEWAIRAGAWSPDMTAFKMVIKGLAKEDTGGKDQVAMWKATLKDEDLKALKQQFLSMYDVLAKDDGMTNDMFNKFTIAATRYGGAMSMSWYISAFSKAYQSVLAQNLWLKTKEVNAGKKWDDWLIDTEIDFENLPESKFANYVRYVEASRMMQTQLILDNRDIIVKEGNIWQALVNKYIETDKENFKLSEHTANLSEERSNLAKLWNIKILDDISKEQGQAWLIVPLAYQQKKASDNFLKAVYEAKDINEVANITKKFMNIQDSLGNLADKYVDSPISKALVKASLAAGVMSYADEIEKNSPWTLREVKDIIGEKAFNTVLNNLTDSPASSIADAFELATNISAHWGGGKWRKWGFHLPKAEKIEQYLNKMIIPNYNRAKMTASSWGGSWVSLPKFATQYGRNKTTWGIEAVKIPVPRAKKLARGDKPTRFDTKTAKLEVRNLPVKEARVIGGRYSARAVKGSKVYSRSVGR